MPGAQWSGDCDIYASRRGITSVARKIAEPTHALPPGILKDGWLTNGQRSTDPISAHDHETVTGLQPQISGGCRAPRTLRPVGRRPPAGMDILLACLTVRHGKAPDQVWKGCGTMRWTRLVDPAPPSPSHISTEVI